MDDDQPVARDIGRLLGLIVHDLRNPAATLRANVGFLEEEGAFESEDAREALEDAELALELLQRGLEQAYWIARWLSEETVLDTPDGDATVVLRVLASKPRAEALSIEVPDEPLRARGAGALPRLIELLAANSAVHAKSATLSAHREPDAVVVTLRDDGIAIAPELRERAFSLTGQEELKTRAEGRYSRVAGLLAARIVAEAMGAALEAGGTTGDAWFRVRLQPLKDA